MAVLVVVVVVVPYVLGLTEQLSVDQMRIEFSSNDVENVKVPASSKDTFFPPHRFCLTALLSFATWWLMH